MSDFSKALGDFARKAEGAPKHLGELLTDKFMTAHTSFPNGQAMLDASGVDPTEMVEGAASERWQAFVRQHTSYPSWETMLQAAVDEWKLDHGLA